MLEKLKSLAVSLKFYSFVAATALFACGTLSESGWITVILTVVGMKEGGKIVSAYRDIKLGSAKGGGKK